MYAEAFLIKKDQFLFWLEELKQTFQLIGPIEEEGFFTFAGIESLKELRLDYTTTMLGPRKFIYQPEERICTIMRKGKGFEVQGLEKTNPQLLIGVRSCDLHAILILDQVFLKKKIQDRNYRLWRENTVVMGLHCLKVEPKCFCASMKTGPLFESAEGYDFFLTDLSDSYLMETLGERAQKLISHLKLLPATKNEFEKKKEIGEGLKAQFQKKIDTTNLVDIILRHQDHPVWKKTAEERCLGCTNCTMVCPSCFCYNQTDQISFDLTTCDRTRYWDSCQELHFAKIHGANFRSSRMARLRQFVTHKLATWVEQLGMFGCVGCGRCMTWCPTGIDLTEMAQEIMLSAKELRIR